MIAPRRTRFNPALVVRDGIHAFAPAETVSLAIDATYGGRDTVTVVQTTHAPTVGSLPGNRWLFTVTVTLQTFGPDIDAALESAYAVADAMLSLDKVGSVRLSSVTSTGEPVDRGHSSPSGASTVVSTYTTYMRNEE